MLREIDNSQVGPNKKNNGEWDNQLGQNQPDTGAIEIKDLRMVGFS